MINIFRKLLGQKLINYYHLATAVVANLIYGFPSRKLHVIGVTGTDGKTTTVNLIASVFREAGLPISFLSTINAQIGQKVFDTGLHTTTPSSFLLQRLLRQMLREKSRYVVLEVTSHALDQYRTWGIIFETAVITNVTPEHLDYHKTFEDYREAKSKLFKNAKNAVLNREDENWKLFNEGMVPFVMPDLIRHPQYKMDSGSKAGMTIKKFITYGLSNKAEVWADQIKEQLQGTEFLLHTPQSDLKVKLNLPGRFNVYNALAVACVGLVYDLPAAKIQQGLEAVKNISGRMEYIEEGQNFTVMIDFAHTPNALRELLSFLRPKVSGRIILVFGSAGERDQNKRPLMGRVADEFADQIVITREDNRSEEVMKICETIASGIKQKQFSIIPDRRAAIGLALKQAKPGDGMVITGKGHEQSLNIDGIEYPWDDREVAREELRKLASSGKR